MPLRSSVAGDLQLALHVGGHLPHALQRLGEALGGLREHLVRSRRLCWVVDAVQQFAGASASPLRANAAPSALDSATMRAISRARPLAPSSDSSSRLEKRLSRCSMSSVRVSSVATSVSIAGAALADRLLGAAVALVDQRDRLGQRAAVGVELRGELAEVGQRLVGDGVERADVLVDLVLVTPLRSEPRSWWTTNSETRVTSVFSIALMFSWAPLKTSWSRMLASRSRSNSVVVSERSMLCVSSISATLADVACRDCSIESGWCPAAP